MNESLILLIFSVTKKKSFPHRGPEIIIKMSSLLNVSNDSSKSEEFNLNYIEVLVDSEERNWLKRVHVGKYLGIARIITLTPKLTEEDIRSWAFLQAEAGIRSMDPLGKMLKIMIFLSRLLVRFMSL